MSRKSIFWIAVLLTIIGLGLFPVDRALAATCTWTGSTGSNWADSSNWDAACGGAAPVAGDSVIIPDVVNDPVVSANAGITDIAINPGGALTVNLGATLSVAGNLNNSGTFDANGSVIFNGSSDQVVSGSGSYDFRGITINTASTANVVEIASSMFLVPNGFLTLQQGIFKLSGSFALTNRIFTTASYAIPTGAGFWLNNPNVTVSAQGGNVRLNGMLRITSGNYSIGNRIDDSLVFETLTPNRASFIMEGGVLNITGRFCGLAQTQQVDFTMSAGTLTVAMIGNTSNGFGSFDIPPGPFSGGNSTFIMSGGTIILQNESTAPTAPLDFRNAATSFAITGGLVQFGTATTLGTPSYVLGITAGNAIYRYPSVVFNPGLGGSATATLLHAMDIYGDLTINSGVTFNQNGKNITSTGNWTHDGVYTPGATGLTAFNGSGVQTISGSSTLAFYNWGINTGSTVVLAANPPTVANTFTNNGRIRQTQSVGASSTANFLQITDGGVNDRYRGVDVTNNSGSAASFTVEVRGNNTVCTSNPADVYRNRCITVANNEAAGVAVDLTIYSTAAEDDVATGDTLYYWDAWLPVPDAVCGTGVGDPCNTTTDLTLASGNNYFLVAGVTAPTAITLKAMSARSSASTLGLVVGLSLAIVVLGLVIYTRRSH